MTYVITEACIDCVDGSCLPACPVDCIYQGERMFYIHPDECVTCGACEYACPVEAIFHSDEVPAAQAGYTLINAEFLLPLGSPGSAKRYGPLGGDHPLVAARPRT
jgi:NAD-dependent dihydropyrimidine dehydrogenase PreA subunit